MLHPLTNAEVENKVAFLVQLNALLTQVSAVVSSSTLGNAQKTKLSDIRTVTEALLKDVGNVGAPRPSIAASAATATSTASPPPSLPAPEATPSTPPTAVEPNATEVTATAAADTAGMPTDAAPAATSAESSPTSALAPAPTPASPGKSSSFTADIASTPELGKGRSLVDLVGYLRLLFDNDIPERMRLQTLGKSLVRLLMVRCCSTVSASLQHVVHRTYAVAAQAGESPSPRNDEEAAAAASPLSAFVALAREIGVATHAMHGCIQLITANAVPSDPASARFPVQLCVDVVKQLRRSLVYFQSRMEKEELYVLRTHVFAAAEAAAAAPGEASPEDVDAAQEAMQREPAEDVAAHVQARAAAMEALWGPSLVHSIRHIADVVGPAVRFLVSVAALRAEGAPATLVALKKDAAHDLFSLSGTASAGNAGPSQLPSGSAARPAGGATAGSLAKPASTGDLASSSMLSGAVGAAVASPVSASSVASPAWRVAAAEVLTRLGSSYAADYLTAVARCSGDGNEGQLLATRLLSDMLAFAAAQDVSLLRCILRDPRWSRPLYDGILNCVVSIQPGVLAAGLEALRLVTTTCPAELGQEIGYLYSNVVLRLLESPNSPHYVKRTIMLHFLTTFMTSTSTVPVQRNGGNAHAIPLLLHLYRLYDLDVHVHQLNFVQQLTSALSRIVRAAPKEDFAQDGVVQEQLRRQQDAIAAPTSEANAAAGAVGPPTDRHDGAGSDAGASVSTAAATLTTSLASLSLPAMALHGLVRTVELLTTQAPPEDETGKDMLATLPVLQCREQKLKEQQQADLFNASPKKAIYKMFGVTAEENAIPEAYSDFASQWDHTRIPPLPSPATTKKVEDVVEFLTCVSSLDPEAVAEFLTTPAVFPLHVCAAYLRRLPLAGCSVLEAISELLMRVQLPKEGQRIERLLEFFSAAYYDANSVPGIGVDTFPFKNDTAVFIVVVATVMLNTNLHNPSAGMRLDLKSFRGQLRRCNDNESFTDTFVDDIFVSITAHPLESVKCIAVDAAAAGAENASRGTFDMFFVSQEEKRQLAFGAERQRMVSETRQLLQLRTQQERRAAVSAEWWCAAAKDLFLSTWSAVCAVFGPAMYDGASAPASVLLQCVRGLQSLLCTAAAFDLPTECTVTLLTLLRMAEATPVRANCRRAVLVVAATSYAVHFPVRCWVAVCQLMLEVRLSATATAPPLVEDVFTRMENLTRLSVEAEEERRAAARPEGDGATTSVPPPSDTASAAVDKPTEAIHRVLEGIMITLNGYAVGDIANMAAALTLLRRAVEFTRIIHGKRAADVVYYVNVRDFTEVVVPAYVELIRKHSASDEGLQVLFDCLVDLLCTMWISYDTLRVAVSSTGRLSADRPSVATAAAAVTVDTAPAEFVRCFRCLRAIYDTTLTPSPDGAATLLQMHVLQALKEVLARTVHAAEVSAPCQRLSLYTMFAAWQQALYPLGMALCDRRSTSIEAGSLALLVLRKLVALSGGTGVASTDRLAPPLRGSLLWLLAQLTYMGGMCGDADGAQVCVALLSSICTTTLAMAAAASTPSVWVTGTPSSPTAALSPAETEAFARAMAERDALTQDVVTAIETGPQYVVQQTLARLCLLLRCEREQTRAEVVHQLRTLSLQARPAQIQPLALDMAEVVLEGAIGHAARHHKTPVTHSSLLPFLFYQMPVPASMRRCSRTSFRATLPAALGFLANELLSGLGGDDLATTAEAVMHRCLLPILLSPNSPYQSRFLAVRSLSQCIAVCLPQKSEAPPPRLARCVLDCLSLALYAVQVPLRAVVPPAATFVGRRWLDIAAAEATVAVPWSTYAAAAADTVRLMDTAEPQWLVRGGGDGEGRGGGSEETRRGSIGSNGLLADEALIEYVNLLAQVLAGVPRELHGVVTSAAAETKEEAAASGAIGADWELPRTSALVLLELTLQAAGMLFAILWRVNHPYEVEQYALQGLELGREAPPLVRNGGLLPHAAIRSVLQCYLELALLSADYPTSEVLATTTAIIEGIRQVQTGAPPLAVASPSSLAADAASLQRLSPQEQQHVRTCNSGMYQQLAAVLGYLVHLLTGPTRAVAPPAPSGWAQRQQAFEEMAVHPYFFSSLVSLLMPTAGTLILTVRDYFAWYIAHTEAPASPPKTGPDDTAAKGQNVTIGSGSGSNGHAAPAKSGVAGLVEAADVAQDGVAHARLHDDADSLL